MTRRIDIGLLVIRLGLGAMFTCLGLAKLLGGPDTWVKLGGAVAGFGLDFWPMGWGFLASLGGTCGGILLMVGLLFRPSCVLLAVIMLVAASTKFGNPDHSLFYDLTRDAGRAIDLLVVFIGLAFVGPGAFALDRRYQFALTRRYQKRKQAQPSHGALEPKEQSSAATRSTVTTELDEW